MIFLQDKIISVSVLGITELKDLRVFLENLNDIREKYSLDNIAIHVDVMDGIFVKNKGVEISIIRIIKEYGFFADVHLMVKDTKWYINSAVEAGADSIVIHSEFEDVMGKLKELKYAIAKESKTIATGIAIKPYTSIEEIKSAIDEVDFVLAMTVEPGLGGQNYIQEVNSKIKELKKNKKIVEVDGGVNDKTIEEALKSGAQIFVVGSYLTKDFSELENRILAIENVINGKENTKG